MKRATTAKRSRNSRLEKTPESSPRVTPRRSKKLKQDDDDDDNDDQRIAKPKSKSKPKVMDVAVKKSSNSRKSKIVDSDDEEEELFKESTDDAEGEDDEEEDAPETSRKEKQLMSKILTDTTFQPLRMKKALDDMRPYLKNKQDQEFKTMEDVRAATYAFRDNASAERFLVEKMRKVPSVIQSWEYKVLVALVFTNIYQDKVGAQDTTQFEKTIFGKGKAKDQELGVKIFCETWRNEAIALFDVYEKALESTEESKPDVHPLKASLLTELLLEFCNFTAKCKVLKSKALLEKIKDPTKYGIDFMEGLTQTSNISHKLKHGGLTIQCNTASGRFRAMIDGESHAKRPVQDGNGKSDPSARQSLPSAENAATAPPIDYKKAAKEDKKRKETERLARSRQSNTSNPSWVRSGSSWGFPSNNGNLPAQPDEVSNNGIVNSIHAWVASSTRTRYNIWGNAGGNASRTHGVNSLINGSLVKDHRSSNGLTPSAE